jgi:hypothetical protein
MRVGVYLRVWGFTGHEIFVPAGGHRQGKRSANHVNLLLCFKRGRAVLRVQSVESKTVRGKDKRRARLVVCDSGNNADQERVRRERPCMAGGMS